MHNFDFSHDVDDPHIVFDNVTYGYERGGDAAIHSVSLKIPRNEITCIIGASGSGKSTLIKALSGVSNSERQSLSYYTGDMYVRSASIDSNGNRVAHELG